MVSFTLKFLFNITPLSINFSFLSSIFPYPLSSDILQMLSHLHQPLPHRHHGYSLFCALFIISNQ